MSAQEEEKRSGGFLKPIAFAVIGAMLGAFGQYVVTMEGKRLDVLQEARRDAYVEFLNVTVAEQLDLERNPGLFADGTASARRKVAVYGDKAVIEALARYWREDFKQHIPYPCCGEVSRIRDDVAVYQRMRMDVMPWQNVTDADMMLLLHMCKIPASEAEAKPCPPSDG